MGDVGLPARPALLLWQDDAEGAPRLTVGVRLVSAPLPISGGAVRLSAALDAVRLTLPAVDPPSAVALTAAELRLAWGEDLSFDAGPVQLKAGSLLLAAGWRQGAGWGPARGSPVLRSRSRATRWPCRIRSNSPQG
ncbi:hypothetical protein SAVCW2_70130 [Streptomyces avermitilis]|uniref:hypothetical protein n=1 Tax=Streptomyces avermitilis TaxID=33903 RepID=UPI0010DE6475|nr:hypothetical protein [Streptomyces avermitilis]GDY87814.1 hypothetical protein SAVCW2_70130 [Streptomyces avermitilis]